MQHRELRFKDAEFRTSRSKDGSMLVSGYVNLTGQFSDPLTITENESFVETIAPGAFARAIDRASANGEDIDFLAEHDMTKILSSTRNNSLTLVEDNKGLYMSAKIANTTWGKDFYSLISEGIIRNFSFGFIVHEFNDEWEFNDSGMHKRTIRDLELFEVSIVRYPAYPQSYVEARGLTTSDEIIEIRKGDKDMAKKVETRAEEEVELEEDKEEPELVDVTGSIIAIDQRLEAIDKKLDEVLKITLETEEEEAEEEEEEIIEEKQEEKDAKKAEAMEDVEETKSKEDDELRSAIDKLIKEFEITEEAE